MSIWDIINNLHVDDPDAFKLLFTSILKQIKNHDFDFTPRIEDKGNCYLIVEQNRLDSIFIHLVPHQVYPYFLVIAGSTPDAFLGFTVLVGNSNDRPVRVSCFGIPCTRLLHYLSSF